MSIIYDALKKVEKSQASKPNSNVSNTIQEPETKSSQMNKPSPLRPKRYILWGIIVSLVLIVVGSFFVFKKSDSISLVDSSAKIVPKPEEAAVTPEQTLQKDKLGVPLVLNGVFFSEDKGYALINNQILSEGDTIEGKIVKRISLTDVELEDENYKIRLSNRAK